MDQYAMMERELQNLEEQQLDAINKGETHLADIIQRDIDRYKVKMDKYWEGQ